MTPDPMAAAYRATQRAQQAARASRGVRLCACGAEYQDTPDGHRQHQTLHGHRPSLDMSAR